MVVVGEDRYLYMSFDEIKKEYKRFCFEKEETYVANKKSNIENNFCIIFVGKHIVFNINCLMIFFSSYYHDHDEIILICYLRGKENKYINGSRIK